ncbi:hypothetical protein L3Q82_014450, partial [Scortum barcoo]
MLLQQNYNQAHVEEADQLMDTGVTTPSRDGGVVNAPETLQRDTEGAPCHPGNRLQKVPGLQLCYGPVSEEQGEFSSGCASASVTGERYCRAQQEAHHDAHTYLCLLASTRNHMILHNLYHAKGERSPEEVAGLVGLRLPTQPG